MVDLKRFGHEAEAGEYICADCRYVVVLHAGSILPICPDHTRQPHRKKGWYTVYGRSGYGYEHLLEVTP